MSESSSAPRASSSLTSQERLAALARHREELGHASPGVALFLFGASEIAGARKTLERIPEAAWSWLEEVIVMETREGAPSAAELAPHAPVPVRVHRDSRHYGLGGERKAAFEHALMRGFEHVITLRGDGTHPPELLPELLHAALVEQHDLVLASRGLAPSARFLTEVANRMLGVRQHDYLSSYRIYAAEALRRVPFQLNNNQRVFEVEILVQFRALGVPVHEVTAEPSWSEAPDEMTHVRRACLTALSYRLHQLHVTRNGRYLVDHGIHYTLKLSPTSSHMLIVEGIRPESRVLDLGCSQGLLARPLKERQVAVTGVDTRPPEHLARELEEYFQHDLEKPLELPTGRVFDYVVCADVIEHLRNREQLLRSARRYLTEGGRLIISTPNIALWFYRLSLAVGRFEYGPRGVLDSTHVHLYTRATFRREVERAGFHVLREQPTALPFEVVFESTGRSRLVRAISGAYHLLARVWPEMFAYQMVLEAEITTLDEEATSPGPATA